MTGLKKGLSLLFGLFFLLFFQGKPLAISTEERNGKGLNPAKEPIAASEILVSLSEQKIYVYGTNGRLIASSIISSGREKYATPAGEYMVIEKERFHYSNLYGYLVDKKNNVVRPATSKEKISRKYRFKGAAMPYFLRLTQTGIGLHGGTTTGRPLSHGCIRLPTDFAAKLFSITPLHTRVLILE